MKAIPQETLETVVYELVMFELFPDDAAIERFVDYYLSNHAKKQGYAKEVARLRAQLQITEQKIDNIMEGVMQGIGIETAHRYLEPLEKEKKQLEYLIADAAEKAKHMDRKKLLRVLKTWLDVATMVSAFRAGNNDEKSSNEQLAQLCERHMQVVLRGPVLQKVIIEPGEDGTPKPKIKLGIDLAKLLSGTVESKAPSKADIPRSEIARSYSKSDRSPRKKHCFGSAFFNDVFRCAEHDVSFGHDVCFANDVRFAHETEHTASLRAVRATSFRREAEIHQQAAAELYENEKRFSCAKQENLRFFCQSRHRFRLPV